MSIGEGAKWFGIAAGLVAVGAGLEAWLPALAAAGIEGQKGMIATSLGQLGIHTAWDALVGPWTGAAAVVGTAAAMGQPAPSIKEAGLRLWGPWLAVTVAMNLGLVLVLPGVAVALFALFCLDPVARVEGRTSVGIPGVARALLLAALAVPWFGMAIAWQMGNVVVNQESLGARLGLGIGHAILDLVGVFGWLVIVRRTPSQWTFGVATTPSKVRE